MEDRYSISECDDHWILKCESGATWKYIFPLSKSHVEREKWRVRTFYQLWWWRWRDNLGEPDSFLNLSKFIAAIACPLDEE